ncbi:YihY/virulence factor BrkB family protein [Geminicoccus roseus]|uniref:YihY/virulence factor BrkB family protein n=1 Tax=Geminicoccus roseus TaxID=404900 RepID=UPI00041D9202|nr:YihY/virulence factor BrkB family protein [Geminicoccus roseus]
MRVFAPLLTLRAVMRRLRDDDVLITGSSVAFFVLLAVFPALSALVALFGLFAEPERIEQLVEALRSILPDTSTQVVVEHIRRFAERWQSAGSVPSFAPYVGFAMLLWSANVGTKGLFRGLNRIYRCEESRGILRFYAVTLLFTLAGILFLLLAIAVVLIIPALLELLGVGEGRRQVIGLLRWPVLLVLVTGVLTLLFRYGPACGRAPWMAVLAGSAVASLLWLGGSVLFSWYVTNLGNLSELYGSLSTVIGFMIWIWLSASAVLIGAEVDSAIRTRRRRSAAKKETPAALRPQPG